MTEEMRPIGPFRSFDPPQRMRTYVYPDGELEFYNVCKVFIDVDDYHYIECDDGGKHVICPGWLCYSVDTDSW